MARITVEDCLDELPNRFSLVLVSAERAKQLLRGAQPMVDNLEGNKEIVLALREIAAGRLSIDDREVRKIDTWTSEDAVAERPAPRPLSDEDELPPEV
ncbi:MAG: DNA-directed RNA polymerase subunit omega [Alphaproteobacteria bacterium]|nr:DNA-directed RNA polymerase subunit omega [Alphaproteobacteria bacterium]